MKKLLSIILIFVFVLSLAGCAQKVDWNTYQGKDVVLEVNGRTYTKDYIQYLSAQGEVSNNISKQLAEGEQDNLAIEEVAQNYDDCLNRIACLAALDAVAEKEGLAVSEEEAKKYTEDTYVGNSAQYDYMQEYMDQLLSKTGFSQEEFLEIAATEMKLMLGADAVSAKYIQEIQNENSGLIEKAVINALAQRMAEETKGITVQRAGKDYRPVFDDYAKEIVLLTAGRSEE